nr:hypothetical protein [Nonlabens ulvanivorans]
MNNYIYLTPIYFSLLFLISCKNHYNDMIHWADQLEEGLSIEEIRNIQPDYIEIDWENPTVNETETMYLFTNIKGNRDILNMDNYLIFNNGKYTGRTSHK